MRLQALLPSVLLSLFVAASEGHQGSATRPHATFECKVTKPNGIAAGQEQPAPGSYGNREVSVGPLDCGQMERSYSNPVVQVSSPETGRSE